MDQTTPLSVITTSWWTHIAHIFARRVIPLLVFLCGAVHAWSADNAGTVRTLTGAASVTRDSAVMPLAVGQQIFPGDRIAAAQSSYVGIVFNDATQVTIGPGSELLISEFEFNPASYAGSLAVSFLKGSARVVTGVLSKYSSDRVRFYTPTATIGIRGTDFIVDLEPE
jgi:hypothetical protein